MDYASVQSRSTRSNILTDVYNGAGSADNSTNDAGCSTTTTVSAKCFPTVSSAQSMNTPTTDNKNNQGTKAVMLPSPVLQFHDNANNTATHMEDTSKHQGRTRSFAHERGIWASYVFIDYSDADGWIELQNECKTFLDTTATRDFVPIERMHLSLTKTFTIRHHNIAPFVENLREQLAGHRRFRLEFSGLEVYVNEERTRTFVGVRVAEESYSPINELVTSVDECLAEYKLPLFYTDRSFHVSILWCLGDREAEVRKELPAITTVFERVYEEEYCDISQQVKQLWFKCGNKMFNFDLI